MATCENCNQVYTERDKLVALAYHMARQLGYKYGIGQHVGTEWEDDWRNIVFIDLPSGQVSWHIHDSELDWFTEGNQIRVYEKPWDGHSTEEKYQRVLETSLK